MHRSKHAWFSPDVPFMFPPSCPHVPCKTKNACKFGDIPPVRLRDIYEYIWINIYIYIERCSYLCKALFAIISFNRCAHCAWPGHGGPLKAQKEAYQENQDSMERFGRVPRRSLGGRCGSLGCPWASLAVLGSILWLCRFPSGFLRRLREFPGSPGRLWGFPGVPGGVPRRLWGFLGEGAGGTENT